MITTFDVETSFQVIDGKKDPSSKNPNNFLKEFNSNITV